jgi:hypothetical protein
MKKKAVEKSFTIIVKEEPDFPDEGLVLYLIKYRVKGCCIST